MKTISINGRQLTLINKNTNRASGIINAYNRADNWGELWNVYGSYSAAKADAMQYCKQLREDCGGFLPVITGCNSSFFSYAFKCVYEGIEYLVYVTHTNDYAIAL